MMKRGRPLVPKREGLAPLVVCADYTCFDVNCKHFLAYLVLAYLHVIPYG